MTKKRRVDSSARFPDLFRSGGGTSYGLFGKRKARKKVMV